MSDPQIAVLIDAENTGLGSMSWLFDQLADEGIIIIKRAYADWSANTSAQQDLLTLNIEPIQLFGLTASGKNASDVRLAMDAMDLLYQAPVDTFVIVSADSDYAPVVSRLRAAGKRVVGAGRTNIAKHMANAYHRFIFLDKSSSESQETGGGRSETNEDTLLLRALELATESDGSALGSKLHSTMQRLDPTFDFKRLGFRSFSDYLSSRPGVKIERSQGPGDIRVVPTTT